MYHFVCFILLVSLEGLKAEETNSDINKSVTLSTNNSTPQTLLSSSALNYTHTAAPTTMSSTVNSNKQALSDQPSDQPGCLINLSDKKEMALWLMIAFLMLICLLLLVIIMCLACKCCKGVRKDELVVMKSAKTTRRNSVNGGPSETDIMLKDCSSVKVETETTPDELQEPEEVGGAAAEVGNQVSTEENKNLANDTSETSPTQEVNQSSETDLKMEDLEKAE